MIVALGQPQPKPKEEPRRPSDEIIQEIRIHLKCISELRRELLAQGLAMNFFQDPHSGQLMVGLNIFRGNEG
jgi:hypothetical protein